MMRIIDVERELEAANMGFDKELGVYESMQRNCPGVNIKDHYGILEAPQRLRSINREKGKIGESPSVVR